MRRAFIIAASWAFLYAACGFISLELNPLNWSEALRFIYVAWVSFVSMMIVLYSSD